MKGDTSLDPTERPNSKLMVPSQQPALTLASAAAEDSRSQLTCITSAIASDDQVICMKSTYFDPSITSSPSTIFEYTCLHFAPARRCLYFSDGPARTLGALCPSLARTTIELCSSPEPNSSPAASSNPLKTDAASPTAAVPLGKLRGSECSGSTGTACTSSGVLGRSTFPATPREIPGPRPEDLRGRHRSRLFETICRCALGWALGRATASFGNPRGTDGPSRGAVLAEGLLLRSLVSADAIVQDFSTALQPVRPLGHLGILGEPMVYQGGQLLPKDLLLRSLVSADAIVQDCSTALQLVRPLGHLGILGEPMVHQGGGLSPKDLPLRSLVYGDAIVQDCSTILQPVRPEGHLAVLLRRLGILGEPMVHQKGELSPKHLFLKSQDSSRQDFFSSRGPI